MSPTSNPYVWVDHNGMLYTLSFIPEGPVLTPYEYEELPPLKIDMEEER